MNIFILQPYAMTDPDNSLFCNVGIQQVRSVTRKTPLQPMWWYYYYSVMVPNSDPPGGDLHYTVITVCEGLGPGQACHLAVSVSILS